MDKVIVFSNKLLPYSETFIKEQILALHGWKTILTGESLVTNGLSLDNLNIELMLPKERNFSWQWFQYRFFRYLGYADPLVTACLKKLDGQLIHAHFGTSAVDIWPYAKKLGLPLLVTLHGYDINIYREWWESGKGGKRLRTYPRRLLRLAREPLVHFIAVSHAIKRRAIEYGIPEEKVTVCYIGVDVHKFTPGSIPIDQRKKRILFVGRLVEKKGAKYLIDAFAKIKQQLSVAELIIIGDGPMRSDLENQISRLALRDVTFKGYRTPLEVKQEMDNARVFCLPSITAENGDAEGFGLVLLEAQASGVPVVTSARGGADEGVLDGITGLVTQEKDVDQISKSLYQILVNDELAKAMSLTARNYIKDNFRIETCTDMLLKEYAITLNKDVD